jgi:hypothetical protein
VTGETGRSDGAFVGRRNELVSQAQGFQLWEASGEEAEQLLTFGVIEQLVRAAPDSGGQADRVLNLIGEEQRVVADGLKFRFQFLAKAPFAMGRRCNASPCRGSPSLSTRWSSTEVHPRFCDVPALRSSNHLTTTRIPATTASPWRRSYRQS